MYKETGYILMNPKVPTAPQGFLPKGKSLTMYIYTPGVRFLPSRRAALVGKPEGRRKEGIEEGRKKEGKKERGRKRKGAKKRRFFKLLKINSNVVNCLHGHLDSQFIIIFSL